MQLNLIANLGNSELGDDEMRPDAVADMLLDLADKVRAGCTVIALRDGNGNTIGAATIGPDES